MDQQMREIEAFEQSQKDARNPKLRQKLRTKTATFRLTPQQHERWKKSNVPLSDLMEAGLKHHKHCRERQELIKGGIRVFLQTGKDKTREQAEIRSILLQTPLRPTLEEYEAMLSEMVRDGEIEALYHLR